MLGSRSGRAGERSDPASREGLARAILLVAAVLAAAIALPARAGSPGADPIRVYYDGGDCGTDAIELEVYDRVNRAWRPHALHPRVTVPSCQVEDAGQLWNELRWRCAPVPDDRDEPAWRPFPVFDAEVMSRCAADRFASGDQLTAISVSSPDEGAVVRAPEPFVELRGSVDVDGLAGSEYDVVLLVDRGAPKTALAAQISAARSFVRGLAPRLGAVRIALLSYPSALVVGRESEAIPPSNGEGKFAGVRRELAWSTDAAALDQALAQIPQRSVVSRFALPAALEAALAVLEDARPAARAVIVLGIDGARIDSTAEPAPGDPLLRAAARVGSRGATLHWIALGGLAAEDPALVRRALTHARGSFRRVPPQAYATPFLGAIALPVAEAVWVEGNAAKYPGVAASLDARGGFRVRVPVASGANALVIHARTSDGVVHERRFALVFDDALVLEKVREAERERIRASQRKRLEIRPDPEP